MGEVTLAVDNLEASFISKRGKVSALRGVSFEVAKGKITGLVGESGSGKSLTAYSIMRLLPPECVVTGGAIDFCGENLLELSETSMRQLRGARIAMVFQDPMMTLNPVLTIGAQLVEAVVAHRKMPRDEAWQKARDALVSVGITSPDERMRGYPHHLSGGMRQRVVIAIALLHEPDLIIADEATTALDVTIQGQILSEVQRLCRERETSLIWITHDLSVVAGLVDNICVMYAGQVVESGGVDAVLDDPKHPYTRGLLDSVPSRNARNGPLRQIPGTAPPMGALPEGCSFRPRCSRSEAICGTAPAFVNVGGGQFARCHFANEKDRHGQ